MELPTIHTNGTSPKDLLEDWMTASSAIRTAIDKLAKAGPNGRDYYLQRTGAFEKAREEHQSRLDRLISVRKEVEAMLDHVADFC